LRYLLNGRCPIFNDLRYASSGLFELRIDLGLSSAIFDSTESSAILASTEA
jgi:hypothetical protein